MCEQVARLKLEAKSIGGVEAALGYVQKQCFASGYLTATEVAGLSKFSVYIMEYLKDWRMAVANVAWLVMCMGIILTSADVLLYTTTHLWSSHF